MSGDPLLTPVLVGLGIDEISTSPVIYAVVAAQGNTRGLILTFDGDASSTVTLISGDEPPSENSGKGNSAALTVANGKQYVLELEAGRWVQDNGTVRILVGGTGPVNVFAFAAASGN